MPDGTNPRSSDVASLLDASFAQWKVEARAKRTGDGAVLVQRGAGDDLLRVEPRRRPDDGQPAWTLDGEALASVLEVLREVRFALDPDFTPARLRISAPPPDDGDADTDADAGAGADSPEARTAAPRSGTEGVGGRTPVFVLTGFLGSGKTTLLNRLLRAEGLRDTAVVVNELGAIGIDHLLVESADDSVVELAGGCLCCAVRGDLARTLGDLVARRAAGTCAPFSRILVETSGLADPTPIESLLVADPALAERMELAGITACVAATSGDVSLDRYPEAARQVAAADLVVTTKTDLGAVPATLDERLRRLNPGAERVAAEFGRVRAAGRAHGRRAGDEAGAGADGGAGTGMGSGSGAESDNGTGGRTGAATAAEDAPTDALPLRRRSRETRPPLPPEPVRHADGIDTLALVRHSPIPGAALTLFLRALVEHAGARLLRLKGFVEIAEAPGRPVTVNGAGHVFEPVEPRPGGWPDADRRSRLVLIGEGISAPWCERLLDALAAEVREAAERLHRPHP